jgi:alcohol dehydrogenase class IV
MADAASGEIRLLSNNPKPLDRSDIENIYRKAW